MSTSKLTWVERVMDSIKGGDASKVAKLHKNTIKHCKTQIGINERAIENIKDKIEDAEETKEETIIGVNMDRIQNTDAINNYIPSFLDSLTYADATIDDLKEEITVHEEQINLYKQHIKTLS